MHYINFLKESIKLTNFLTLNIMNNNKLVHSAFFVKKILFLQMSLIKYTQQIVYLTNSNFD